MDPLSLLGLTVGFLAIFLGQYLEGGSLYTLMNLSAFLIVVGGTLGAVMLQTPMRSFFHAFRILPWIFFPPSLPFEECRTRLVELAKKSRQYGLLSLEDHIEHEPIPMMRLGLELLVLGVDKTMIRQILESEQIRVEDHDQHSAQVFESMGGYSPTVGILGAVLGLIQVMRNLSAPSSLGEGIAVAFVATIYGVGLANLLYLPVANKLKYIILHRAHLDEMIIEGICGMASGESPNMLNHKLANYGTHHQNGSKKKE